MILKLSKLRQRNLEASSVIESHINRCCFNQVSNRKSLWFVIFFLIHTVASSQSLSPKSTRTIAFTTDEGTCMNVDVAPDGRTLVFDLLGDLYTVPITGGTALLLLRNADWVRAPRFSPDGKHLAFISDHGDVNNLWVMELASRKIRQLTQLEPKGMHFYGLHGTPIWLPNGQEITYLNQGYYKSEVGSGISAVNIQNGDTRILTKKLKFLTSPTFTPDGKSFYNSVSVSNSKTGLSMQTLHRVLLDDERATVIKPVESRPTEFGDSYCVGDIKPVLSRSGRYLAYIHTIEPASGELRVRDLKDGGDRRLMSLPDLANNWSGITDDGYPGYAITPDEKDVVIWSQGKLFRVPIGGGNPRLIPFVAEVKQEVAVPLRAHYRIADGDLEVKAIRWPTMTPDQKKLIFSAVGFIWIMDLPTGNPRRLTDNEDFELMPALSPNGKELAYIISDKKGGDFAPRRLVIRNMESGKTRIVTASTDSASYLLPSWSADNSKIAIVRQPIRLSKNLSTNTYGSVDGHEYNYGWIDCLSGKFHQVATSPTGQIQEYVEPAHVIFSRDGNQLLYVDRGTYSNDRDDQYKFTLYGVSLDGSKARTLLTTADPSITAIIPSPDQSKAIVLGWDYEAYLAELPRTGEQAKSVSIFDLEKKGELKQISKGGALYPRWINDHTVSYGWLKSIYAYKVEDNFSHQIATVDLKVPRKGNAGTYALRNARIITMNGEHGPGKVFERGTIVIRDNRVIAVGAAENVSIPPDVTIVDASGVTIMPGLIDGHSHGIGPNRFRLPSKSLLNGLSYGFTTCLDAASDLNDDTGLGNIELLESGRVLGPRYFSTTGLVSFWYTYPQESRIKYRSFEEVQNQVRRRVELGAQQCIKQKVSDNYRQFSRWMARAAQEAGVSAIAHIQMSPKQQLARTADGYHLDHNGLWAPSYRDVIEFTTLTGAIWTIHHDMVYGEMSRPPYSDVAVGIAPMFERFGNSKEREIRLSGFLPKWSTWRNIPIEDIAPLEISRPARLARLAAQIAASGGKIAGASTDAGPSLESHFELWEFRKEGMSPGDILRTATMIPAEKLGIQEDAGSIEVGKLADMIMLSDNPLERIESTLKIKYTILAGSFTIAKPSRLFHLKNSHP